MCTLLPYARSDAGLGSDNIIHLKMKFLLFIGVELKKIPSCILIILLFLAKETKLIEGEQQIVGNTLITTLPYMRKEYAVRFEVKATSLLSNSLNSIIHFTNKNTNTGGPGGRIPAVWFYYSSDSSGRIYFEATVNNTSYGYTTESSFSTGEWISIEVDQTKSSSEYRYNIKVNGQLLHSVVNTYPEDFPDVKVYVSGPSYTALNGYIRNLSVFLHDDV